MLSSRASLAVIVLGFISAVASAATLEVNRLDTGCDDIAGTPFCAIQAAVDAASSNDVLDIAPGTYEGPIDISPKNISIVGAGLDETIINGSVLGSRVFNVQEGAVVSISNLTISNGTVGDGEHGGGVKNQGQLTLQNCVIEDNTSGGNGGGVSSGGPVSASLTIENCTLRNNTSNGTDLAESSSGGGGVYSASDLIIRDSVLYRNIAAQSGGGVFLDPVSSNVSALISGTRMLRNESKYGGGIHTKADLTFTHSSLLINKAWLNSGGEGGGLLVGESVTVNIVNSLLYQNYSVADGGGIYHSRSATLGIYSSTIAWNESTNGHGGGVYVNSEAGEVRMGNTLISDNSNSPLNRTAPDCSGTIQSLGYNLVENRTGCYLTPAYGDYLGFDAKTKVSSEGGGEDQSITISLFEDSFAVDGGNPNDCVDHQGATIGKDLSGNVRHHDGNGDGGLQCDIGAFELSAIALPVDEPTVEEMTVANSTASVEASASAPAAKKGGGGSMGVMLWLISMIALVRRYGLGYWN